MAFSGDKLLDAITDLNSKIDKLQATMEKVEVNTKVSVSL